MFRLLDNSLLQRTYFPDHEVTATVQLQSFLGSWVFLVPLHMCWTRERRGGWMHRHHCSHRAVLLPWTHPSMLNLTSVSLPLPLVSALYPPTESQPPKVSPAIPLPACSLQTLWNLHINFSLSLLYVLFTYSSLEWLASQPHENLRPYSFLSEGPCTCSVWKVGSE